MHIDPNSLPGLAPRPALAPMSPYTAEAASTDPVPATRATDASIAATIYPRTAEFFETPHSAHDLVARQTAKVAARVTRIREAAGITQITDGTRELLVDVITASVRTGVSDKRLASLTKTALALAPDASARRDGWGIANEVNLAARKGWSNAQLTSHIKKAEALFGSTPHSVAETSRAMESGRQGQAYLRDVLAASNGTIDAKAAVMIVSLGEARAPAANRLNVKHAFRPPASVEQVAADAKAVKAANPTLTAAQVGDLVTDNAAGGGAYWADVRDSSGLNPVSFGTPSHSGEPVRWAAPKAVDVATLAKQLDGALKSPHTPDDALVIARRIGFAGGVGHVSATEAAQKFDELRAAFESSDLTKNSALGQRSTSASLATSLASSYVAQTLGNTPNTVESIVKAVEAMQTARPEITAGVSALAPAPRHVSGATRAKQ